MRRNIEWKARLHDPDGAFRGALAAGATDHGMLQQRDTYFHVACGRLKLREQQPGGVELIQYVRADEAGARGSEYRLVPMSDGVALRDALEAALGTRVVVVKSRRLLVADRTRIHLDTVDGLGTFAEIEVVLRPDDQDAPARQEAEHWRTSLGVAAGDVEALSYAELLSAADDAHQCR